MYGGDPIFPNMHSSTCTYIERHRFAWGNGWMHLYQTLTKLSHQMVEFYNFLLMLFIQIMYSIIISTSVVLRGERENFRIRSLIG